VIAAEKTNLYSSSKSWEGRTSTGADSVDFEPSKHGTLDPVRVAHVVLLSED
jgi:hypothetical protein